jgi:predicted lipid-binding transport protein (Tim44 family)
MGLFQQYFDIILFAMIAGFLVLRLRSVLGRRTGNERRRDLFVRRPPTPAENLAGMREASKVITAPPAVVTAASGVAEGVERIRRADPSFDPAQFAEGARSAFEMIVGAFASGDKATLKSLLSQEVLRSFSAAIDERAAAHETLETRIVRLESIDLVEADLHGSTAQVTVKLVSRQINVTRAMDGSIVDGDPQNPIDKTDYWTFSRDTRSSDPNWTLVATSSG